MDNKELVKLIDEVFEVLNKAKFESLDGNEIIKFGNTFKKLAKAQQTLLNPEPLVKTKRGKRGTDS